MIKFLDLQKQYHEIKADIDKAVMNTIEEAAFIGGERVSKFESNFAKYQNSKFCIGVGNGTDALEIAIETLNLPLGSEVIVPANSFIASSEAISRSGLKVVFCDVCHDNFTIDIDSLESRINSNTSAVMAVHLYGHPCDMDEILRIANRHHLKVIEDCAQAHGAEYKGKRVGALGDVGTFSFYPGKNLGAYGDGGAIVTNDEKVAKQARMIANHGRTKKYDHQFEGRNSRLDALQAAVLDVKLEHLDNWTNRRIRIANSYLEQLKDVKSLELPKREEYAKQVYHLFVIKTDYRDELAEHLKKDGIQTGVHYPIALPKLDAYKYLNQIENNPVACSNDEKLLSLPIGEHITEQDVNKISNSILSFFEGK